MLKLYFGEVDGAVVSGDWFDHQMDYNVVMESFSKKIIADIDKSKVNTPFSIESPVLGGMTYSSLSGGVKALMILMYCEDDIFFDLAGMGDNCFKYLPEIASVRDIKLCSTELRVLRPEMFNDGIYILNDDTIVRKSSDLAWKFVDIKGDEVW